MNGIQKILIVDSSVSDQQFIALLFKRGLHGSNSCLSIAYASCLTEARNLLTNEQFEVITLDGEFPSFVDSRLGHDLIPFIKETQKEPTIIMFSRESLYIKQGLKNGANYGFIKHEIPSRVKFNEKFELVPLQEKVSE